MYKIYINENLLTLGSTDTYQELRPAAQGLPYFGKSKSILNIVDRCEKRQGSTDYFLHSDDLPKLWEDFQSLFKNINAAGGLVQNPQAEMLFIFRRGFWDLPKGKMDAGESIRQTAIREVEEETGILAQILDQVAISLHTYRTRKGKRVLKHTYWYLMQCLDSTLQLQHEEDIEKAIWARPQKEDFWIPHPIYRSLADMLAEVEHVLLPS